MPIRVLNEADIDRELLRLSAGTYQPAAKKWLQTVVKSHLLGLTGKEKKAEFKRYTRNWKRVTSDGVPDILPDWVEEAMRNKQPVYVFDPIQVYRRTTWKTINTIVVWFNSAAPNLKFKEAAKKAAKWAEEVNFRA